MLKDLIYEVAVLLKLDNICEYIDALSDPDTAADVEEPSELNYIKNICNFTIRQVQQEYMPLYHEEQKTSNNSCEIALTGFEHNINKIKNIYYEDGLAATFRVFPEYIKVGYPNTAYKITYSYFTNDLTSLEDSLSLPLGLSLDTLAKGVCAGYCLGETLYDEADMFEQMFKTGLENNLKSLREKKVARRGWY